MKRRSLRFAALALVVPAIASCSGGGSSAKQSAASIPATVTTGAAANAAARLATLLITDLPAGYIQQPDNVGDTGPSDLAKAARDDGKPDAANALTADGFLAGYQRLWATADRSQRIIVYLYKFQTSAGASAYEKRGIANDENDPESRAVAFPVSSIPGATGLASAQRPTVALVVFAKGSYVVQVVTSTPTGSRSLAEQLAGRQYGRLSGS